MVFGCSSLDCKLLFLISIKMIRLFAHKPQAFLLNEILLPQPPKYACSSSNFVERVQIILNFKTQIFCAETIFSKVIVALTSFSNGTFWFYWKSSFLEKLTFNFETIIFFLHQVPWMVLKVCQLVLQVFYLDHRRQVQLQQQQKLQQLQRLQQLNPQKEIHAKNR